MYLPFILYSSFFSLFIRSDWSLLDIESQYLKEQDETKKRKESPQKQQQQQQPQSLSNGLQQRMINQNNYTIGNAASNTNYSDILSNTMAISPPSTPSSPGYSSFYPDINNSTAPPSNNLYSSLIYPPSNTNATSYNSPINNTASGTFSPFPSTLSTTTTPYQYNSPASTMMNTSPNPANNYNNPLPPNNITGGTTFQPSTIYPPPPSTSSQIPSSQLFANTPSTSTSTSTSTFPFSPSYSSGRVYTAVAPPTPLHPSMTNTSQNSSYYPTLSSTLSTPIGNSSFNTNPNNTSTNQSILSPQIHEYQQQERYNRLQNAAKFL